MGWPCGCRCSTPPSPIACLRWHAAPAWRRSTRCSRWAGQQRHPVEGQRSGCSGAGGRSRAVEAAERGCGQDSMGRGQQLQVVVGAWVLAELWQKHAGQEATKASGGVVCDAPGAHPDAVGSAAAPFFPCRMRQAPTCRAFWALKSGRSCPQVRLCGQPCMLRLFAPEEHAGRLALWPRCGKGSRTPLSAGSWAINPASALPPPLQIT